jgi:hypothetical protein
MAAREPAELGGIINLAARGPLIKSADRRNELGEQRNVFVECGEFQKKGTQRTDKLKMEKKTKEGQRQIY